jgi:hypothetical protein
MLPDIITGLQFRTKTSLELSMHQYRPDVFPNNKGYTNTQDIIQFQNNLGKPHQKILAKRIFSKRNLTANAQRGYIMGVCLAYIRSKVPRIFNLLLLSTVAASHKVNIPTFIIISFQIDG